MRIPDLMLVSMKFYNSLNPDQQKAIVEAGARAQAYMRGAWHVSEVKDLLALKKDFKGIITPDKAPFVKAVSGMVHEEAKRLNVEKEVAFILDSQKNF
jgi:TRAP-type C4-dicarboxylate transport system substrate-binding protein